MGHIGEPDHPEVQATIDDALAQIVAAGRVAGTIGADATRRRYLDMGVRFFYTSWTGWLAQGAKAMRGDLAAWNGEWARR
jgi:4-hydroxy-2-oxoheptanedioate aldolase